MKISSKTQNSNPGPEAPASQQSTSLQSQKSRSKIGSFPKSVRDQLNQMIDDGFTFKQIKAALGEHGQTLRPNNLTEWKKRGFLFWQNEQVWREEIRLRMDSFIDLAQNTNPTQLPIAGLQLSLTQLCEQLRDLGPGTRKEQFEQDADKYLRMLNTLSRLSKSLITLEKFQRETAAAPAALELQRKDPNRKMSIAEDTAIFDRADDYFGFKSAARLRAEFFPDLNSAPQPASSSASIPASPAVPKSDAGGPAAPNHSAELFQIVSENSKVSEDRVTGNGSNSVDHAVPQSKIPPAPPGYCPYCLSCITPLYPDAPPFLRCPTCGNPLPAPPTEAKALLNTEY